MCAVMCQAGSPSNETPAVDVACFAVQVPLLLVGNVRSSWSSMSRAVWSWRVWRWRSSEWVAGAQPPSTAAAGQLWLLGGLVSQSINSCTAHDCINPQQFPPFRHSTVADLARPVMCKGSAGGASRYSSSFILKILVQSAPQMAVVLVLNAITRNCSGSQLQIAHSCFVQTLSILRRSKW